MLQLLFPVCFHRQHFSSFLPQTLDLSHPHPLRSCNSGAAQVLIRHSEQIERISPSHLSPFLSAAAATAMAAESR